MIPTEVADIANLIWPGWSDIDCENPENESMFSEILAGACRIYNAGYQLTADNSSRDQQ
jgi:hypothetical protein